MNGLHGRFESDRHVATAGRMPQSKGWVRHFGQFVSDGRYNSGGKSFVRSADHFEHELSRESVRRLQQLNSRQFCHWPISPKPFNLVGNEIQLTEPAIHLRTFYKHTGMPPSR